MIDLRTLEEQLKRAGCNFRFWGRSELNELKHILMDGETIAHGVNGHYAGGFALLCVTDRRLLLVDRKPMYLTLEDVRFEMISEVDYSYRLLDATIKVFTPNKSLVFTSWSQHRLRELSNYTQERLIAVRQYYLGQQFQQVATRPVPEHAIYVPEPLVAGATVQDAGQMSVSSPPIFRPLQAYGQMPMTSRPWYRRARSLPDS